MISFACHSSPVRKEGQSLNSGPTGWQNDMLVFTWAVSRQGWEETFFLLMQPCSVFPITLPLMLTSTANPKT